MQAPWKNLLFCTHTGPADSPPAFAPHTVICGPQHATRQAANGDLISVHTPSGQPYDIASLINSLPAHQQPELLLVHLDAALSSRPVNLSRVGMPKIAVVGATCGAPAALERLIDYVFRERFDFLLLEHGRQQAHWFYEAGVRNIVWMPALLLADDFLPAVQRTDAAISFSQTLQPIQPRCQRLITALGEAGLPVNPDKLTRLPAATRYNQARLVIHCSQGSELEQPVFDILAHGGLLLTDRLSPLSGLYQLFDAAEAWVDFSGRQELIGHARHYLQHEDQRNHIARGGSEAAQRQFSLPARLHALDQLLNHARIDSINSIAADGRVGAYQSPSSAHLFFRLRLYQWARQQHSRLSGMDIICSETGDIRICCDLADLPRLNIYCHLPAGSQAHRIAEKARLTQVFRELADAPGQAPARAIPVTAAAVSKPDAVSLAAAGMRAAGPGVAGRKMHAASPANAPAEAAHCRVLICTTPEWPQITRRYPADAVLFADWLELEETFRRRLQAAAAGHGLSTADGVEGLFIRAGAWQSGDQQTESKHPDRPLDACA